METVFYWHNEMNKVFFLNLEFSKVFQYNKYLFVAMKYNNWQDNNWIVIYCSTNTTKFLLLVSDNQLIIVLIKKQ